MDKVRVAVLRLAALGAFAATAYAVPIGTGPWCYTSVTVGPSNSFASNTCANDSGHASATAYFNSLEDFGFTVDGQNIYSGLMLSAFWIEFPLVLIPPPPPPGAPADWASQLPESIDVPFQLSVSGSCGGDNGWLHADYVWNLCPVLPDYVPRYIHEVKQASINVRRDYLSGKYERNFMLRGAGEAIGPGSWYHLDLSVVDFASSVSTEWGTFQVVVGSEVPPAETPEPKSFILAGSGVALLASGLLRRRRSASRPHAGF